MQLRFHDFGDRQHFSGGVTRVPADANAVNLVGRVVRYFRSRFSEGDYSGQWEGILKHRLGPVVATLAAGNIPACVELLQNPARSNLLFGFEGVFADALAHRSAESVPRRAEILRAQDTLLRLAEALGVLPLPNPEARQMMFDHSGLSPDDVVDRIEDKLGIDISTPNVFNGYSGLLTKRGVGPLRPHWSDAWSRASTSR